METPFSFAKHSSIGCGGNAPVCYYPRSVGELTAILKKLKEEGTRYLILGNLTNVLPLSGGFDGAIVRATRLSGVKIGKTNTIFAYAGTSSGRFLETCKAANLSGGEFLYGVPCTVGGALYMNAGAGGRYIAELVESVLVLREGKEILLPVEECGYAYKKSAFMENGDCILGANLRLAESTPCKIEEQIEEYKNRRAHLPKGKSMGCVFKNPENGFAGALIEGCGLKGLRLGGAKISEQHANFILNEGGATPKDITTLIAIIKNAVRAQYGVRLQEEIRYIGTE